MLKFDNFQKSQKDNFDGLIGESHIIKRIHSEIEITNFKITDSLKTLDDSPAIKKFSLSIDETNHKLSSLQKVVTSFEVQTSDLTTKVSLVHEQHNSQLMALTLKSSEFATLFDQIRSDFEGHQKIS